MDSDPKDGPEGDRQYMHGVSMISYRKIFNLCSPFNDLTLRCVNND